MAVRQRADPDVGKRVQRCSYRQGEGDVAARPAVRRSQRCDHGANDVEMNADNGNPDRRGE
jgi:hypothetical protein